MKLKKNEGLGKKFITVLADGKFHQTVPEGTEGAVIREYEDSKGVKGSKTELVFDEVSGVITAISFDEGDFGKSLVLEIDGDGVVSLNTAGNFGEDVMKKLPNINLKQSVKLVPYSFEDEGKSRKGITIYQNDEKVQNHYYDSDKKKVSNGMPEFDGDAKDKDDWKIYFMKVRKFLISETEKLAIDF
jgi:hypothetical protein